MKGIGVWETTKGNKEFGNEILAADVRNYMEDLSR